MNLDTIQKRVDRIEQRDHSTDDSSVDFSKFPADVLDGIIQNLLIGVANTVWLAGGGLDNPEHFEAIKAELEADCTAAVDAGIDPGDFEDGAAFLLAALAEKKSRANSAAGAENAHSQ